MKIMMSKESYMEYGKEYKYSCNLKNAVPFHLRTLCRTLKSYIENKEEEDEMDYTISDFPRFVFNEVLKRCNKDTPQNELDMRIGIVRIYLTGYADDEEGIYSHEGWEEYLEEQAEDEEYLGWHHHPTQEEYRFMAAIRSMNELDLDREIIYPEEKEALEKLFIY